jgi:hypothetical protein
MKKAVLGMSALALLATAAWAGEGDKDRKVAAVDTSVASFSKLDADGDGRVSAIEAANDSSVAANFTTADSDKDGYLSRTEFQSMGQSDSGDESSSPQSETATEPTP